MPSGRARRLHLVRHAEVENPRGIIYGSLPGFGLSARGRAQAERAAAELVVLVRGPARLIASPLQRAQETAEILSRELEPESVAADPDLREASTAFDGLPRRSPPWVYLGRLLQSDARKNGESPRNVARRMKSAIETALADTSELVVVSHQFPIRMARVAFERGIGLVPWLFARSPCEHASITTLELDGERVVRVAYWEPGE